MTDFSNNISLAEKYLNRFAPKPTTHYINGAWVPADECQTFTNSTPIDNTSLGEVTSGSSHEVNSACAAAEAAFPEWRDMPGLVPSVKKSSTASPTSLLNVPRKSPW